MKHTLIAIGIIWALVLVSGLIWSSNGPRLEGAIGNFLEEPHRSINNPYRNGYFYLFALTAPASLDPAKVGYEKWVDGSDEAQPAPLKHENVNRVEPSLMVSPTVTSLAWKSIEPLDELHKQDRVIRATIAQQQPFLTRYARWLELPFEDWGFGRRLTPNYQSIMSMHRLYVLEGFSMGMQEGLDRLRKELQFGRLMLREAKTVGTKMLAQVLITDDLKFLSRILSKPVIDQSLLSVGQQLTLPLTPSEYSLRWPIRNQLALAIKEPRNSWEQDEYIGSRENDQIDWLIRESGLTPKSFEGIEHPTAPSIFGLRLQAAQAWNTYATYYDALITASESKAMSLPTLYEITKSIQRGMLENFLNPHPIEPDWTMFYQKLIETDARLRLASLQIQLRRPSAQIAVPTRLAGVGSQYFDPFTGLPMLWSPTQHKIYSVGKDRLDDGGDPTFDISVPAIVTDLQTAMVQSPPSSHPPHSTR